MELYELEDFKLKREELIDLSDKGILPFKLKDVDQDEMSFIIFELDDFPETQQEIKELLHREVNYRKTYEDVD